MKVLYLASHTATLEHPNVVYQDITGNRDIGGDMMDVDLTGYDLIIATPPCNYYSRANYRRETSVYAQATKHLLPDIINKLKKLGKPFIVENVINKVLMRDIIDNFVDDKHYYKELGRHSYFTNIDVDISHIKQVGYDVQKLSSKQRQGGLDVNNTFNYIIDFIKKGGL